MTMTFDGIRRVQVGTHALKNVPAKNPFLPVAQTLLFLHSSKLIKLGYNFAQPERNAELQILFIIFFGSNSQYPYHHNMLVSKCNLELVADRKRSLFVHPQLSKFRRNKCMNFDNCRSIVYNSTKLMLSLETVLTFLLRSLRNMSAHYIYPRSKLSFKFTCIPTFVKFILTYIQYAT